MGIYTVLQDSAPFWSGRRGMAGTQMRCVAAARPARAHVAAIWAPISSMATSASARH